MLTMQIIIEKCYVEIRHTHPIAQVGFIYPKAGVVPRVAGSLEVSEGGNEYRIHANGDQFAYDGTNWHRVYDINSVDFVAKKFK